jgi:hypothetical protein
MRQTIHYKESFISVTGISTTAEHKALGRVKEEWYKGEYSGCTFFTRMNIDF